MNQLGSFMGWIYGLMFFVIVVFIFSLVTPRKGGPFK